jgi:methylaspartate ammonia-lyase
LNPYSLPSILRWRYQKAALMKIVDALWVNCRGGFFNIDLKAVREGAPEQLGASTGQPKTEGFKSVSQPGAALSIVLRLEDGSVAFGDCMDVIFSGAAGRDRLFIADEHRSVLDSAVRPLLLGTEDVAHFRHNAETIDRWAEADGRRLHTALRYGLTQALLHAASLSTRQPMAQIIAQDYGTVIAGEPSPILASCARNDWMLLDRMIGKKADLLPHSDFPNIALLGEGGRDFKAYAERVARRITEIGAKGYKPKIHLDVYGSIGRLFDTDIKRIVGFLKDVRQAVQPYDLLIESPLVLDSKQAQIAAFKELRQEIMRNGADVGIIADEWCNTLEDIQEFIDAGSTDYVQIKMPDLGGINNSIEAVVYAKRSGVGACLGGSGNETDQSARITAHIALATRPDFLLSKPGFGGDEALMILGNEMARTTQIIRYFGRSA